MTAFGKWKKKNERKRKGNIINERKREKARNEYIDEKNNETYKRKIFN